jgi:hypothetical protein
LKQTACLSDQAFGVNQQIMDQCKTTEISNNIHVRQPVIHFDAGEIRKQAPEEPTCVSSSTLQGFGRKAGFQEDSNLWAALEPRQHLGLNTIAADPQFPDSIFQRNILALEVYGDKCTRIVDFALRKDG